MIPRRLLGALLLVAAYAPLHRLLVAERSGPAGVATRAAAEGAWTTTALGTVIVLGAAVALSRLVPGARWVAAGGALLDRLERFRSVSFATAAGVVCFGLALSCALWLHGGAPTSVDEMAQLLHAQALRSGSLSVPTLGVPAAILIQNGVLTPDGWASIYPPLHTLLLAAGLVLGAPWAVGPVALGFATFFATLALERVMGTRLGRAAGGLLAISPFWIVLGSTHLSHTTAAAALALALWAAVRSTDGGAGWALLLGAAIGAAVTSRPWVGLAISPVLVAAVWLPSVGQARVDVGLWARRGAAVLAGGAPFAALLFWWNESLFGSPFRLGYEVAFGPAHGLGLHVDPWGNRYGVVEALAYSGADLTQLGARLLETPLPAVGLVGLGLLVAPRAKAPGVLLAWIVAAVLANAAYWHHGVHFGPRMLFESTPAWVALFVAAAAAVGSRPEGKGAGAWLVALTLVGGLLLAPGATLAIRSVAEPPSIELADAPADAVVFVHGTWASRNAARLAAAGMRRDSIETALRRNDICAVDRYVRWRRGGAAGPPPPLDFEPRPGSPEGLRTRLLSEGNPVRVDPGVTPDDGCTREAAADRLGVAELEPLLWRTPPTATGRLLLRDLGPADNVRSTELSGRPWLLYVAGERGAQPRLLDYDVGMELLWRGAAAIDVR